MNTLARISEILPNLKSAERRVADYVLREPDRVIEYPITELAEKTDVSEPTVVRLCQKIGLKGYMELKLNLASELPSPAYVHRTIGDESTPIQALDIMLDAHGEALRRARGLISTEDFETAVAWICEAERIDFYGFGGSGCVAADAHNKFFRLGMACNYYRDVHMQFISASLLDDKSLVAAISTNGSTRNIIETTKIARDAGARVIGIIGREESPLHAYCHLTFSLPCQEAAPAIQRLSTRLVQTALLDALYVSALLKSSKIRSNLEKVKQSLSQTTV